MTEAAGTPLLLFVSAVLTALLASELRNTQGGRNLAGIGLVRDVDDVARFDTVEVVGELDIASWRIAIRR